MSKQEIAETLGLQALGWVISQDGLRDAFLGESGLGLDELRQRAGEPELLASVLDFLLQADSRVLDFARDAGVNPATILSARHSLPGGEVTHWT